MGMLASSEELLPVKKEMHSMYLKDIIQNGGAPSKQEILKFSQNTETSDLKQLYEISKQKLKEDGLAKKEVHDHNKLMYMIECHFYSLLINNEYVQHRDKVFTAQQTKQHFQPTHTKIAWLIYLYVLCMV